MARAVKKTFANNANRQKISPRKTPVRNYQPGLSLAGNSYANGVQTKGRKRKTSSLQRLFIKQLQHLYYTERIVGKTLANIESATTSQQLKNVFADHLMMTREQTRRLEQVFQFIGLKASAYKSAGIVGLIKELNRVIAHTTTGRAVRDAALIIAAKKIEHYEIAAYRALARMAQQSNYHDAERHLKLSLEEEEQTDLLLTDIAIHRINDEALH